jgi:guanine deaminase
MRPETPSALHLHRAALFSPLAPDQLQAHDDGCLAVSSDGRIAAVGDSRGVSEQFPHAQLTDWRPAAILPGLVDLHSHIPQYAAVALDGYELLPWLERFIYPTEAAFADPHHALEASRRFFSAALARGTTTLLLYATVHAEGTRMAFRAAEEAGVRAAIGKVMMDRNAPPDLLEDTSASLGQAEALCGEWNGAAEGRLRYAFSPRFAITCSPELMREAARLGHEHNALIQTHLAENTEELRTVAALFPEAPHYTGVYADAGLLGPRTVMAHCLYLSAAEWDLLAESGTRVAHCAGSNFFLRSGVFDMAQAKDRGIPVGLGTDVGAGPSLSMFDEMQSACFAARARYAMERSAAARLASMRDRFAALSGGADLLDEVLARLELDDAVALVDPVHALYLATLGGANALGMADDIGSLEPGKWADFVVVDLNSVDPALGEARHTPRETLSQIIYRTDPAAIAATFIAGVGRHTRSNPEA